MIIETLNCFIFKLFFEEAGLVATLYNIHVGNQKFMIVVTCLAVTVLVIFKC